MGGSYVPNVAMRARTLTGRVTKRDKVERVLWTLLPAISVDDMFGEAALGVECRSVAWKRRHLTRLPRIRS